MSERKSPASKPTGSSRGPSKPGASQTDGAARKLSSGKVNSGRIKPATTGTAKTGSTTGRPAAARSTSRPAGKGPAQKRPARKRKSIVNQKQRPWGLIIAAIGVVAFAVVVVGVVVATRKAAPGPTRDCTKMIGNSSTSYLNELQCAKDISGVTFHREPNRNHVTGTVTYNTTPPVGGNHNPNWGDCTGTVYPNAIANENAVHMLEHGAVWITYNKTKLSTAQVNTLAKNVAGIDRMAMSPYPNLKTAISLQSWGYQLFLNSPTDPRIAQFISALKYNPKTTPEYGATCSQPTFKSNPSTFGHPVSS